MGRHADVRQISHVRMAIDLKLVATFTAELLELLLELHATLHAIFTAEHLSEFRIVAVMKACQQGPNSQMSAI